MSGCMPIKVGCRGGFLGHSLQGPELTQFHGTVKDLNYQEYQRGIWDSERRPNLKSSWAQSATAESPVRGVQRPETRDHPGILQ